MEIKILRQQIHWEPNSELGNDAGNILPNPRMQLHENTPQEHTYACVWMLTAVVTMTLNGSHLAR